MKKILLAILMLSGTVAMAQPYHHNRDRDSRWDAPKVSRYDVNVRKIDWNRYVVESGMVVPRGRVVILNTKSCGIRNGRARLILSPRESYLENNRDHCFVRTVEQVDGYHYRYR